MPLFSSKSLNDVHVGPRYITRASGSEEHHVHRDDLNEDQDDEEHRDDLDEDQDDEALPGLLHRRAPTRGRGQRHTALACDARVFARHRPGTPILAVRFPIEGPFPPLEVLVVPRRAVDVPPMHLDHRGHLVGEVLVVWTEGHRRQEVPEELVGLGTAREARLREERPTAPFCLARGPRKWFAISRGSRARRRPG